MKDIYHSLDFRDFRPAAVLVIDLVKHSKRSKWEIHSIQRRLSSVFEEAIRRLSLPDVHFNYSGDGYVVAFLGDSSTRVLDFLNAAIPQLSQKLSEHNQAFRAGLDFGLVHMSENCLTGSAEHFDVPGIQAARLEASAQENQILASETVFNLFRFHYPSMFGPATSIKAKDREMTAHSVEPVDFSDVRRYFEDLIFRKAPDIKLPIGKRNRVLFVDDDHYEYFPRMYGELLPEFTVEAVQDGAEALDKFEPGRYAVVVTDELMPRVQGVELTERLVRIDADLPVVMLTCFSSEDLAKRFFAAGGTCFLHKIGDFIETRKAIRRSIVTNVASPVRSKLGIITDDIGDFLYSLQVVSDEFNTILADARQSQDLSHSLLRHKAKQIILTYLDATLPGNDVSRMLKEVKAQLECVHRLLRAVGSVDAASLEKHLKEYTADMMKLNPKVSIDVSFDQLYSLVRMPYAGLLTLIICELLDNALAAIVGSGRIEARLSHLHSARILRASVADSGPGVPQYLHASMFAPGVSSKGAGRGLGLCLVKEAVSALKGEIRYDYEQGAVFTITIPSAVSDGGNAKAKPNKAMDSDEE